MELTPLDKYKCIGQFARLYIKWGNTKNESKLDITDVAKKNPLSKIILYVILYFKTYLMLQDTTIDDHIKHIFNMISYNIQNQLKNWDLLMEPKNPAFVMKDINYLIKDMKNLDAYYRETITEEFVSELCQNILNNLDNPENFMKIYKNIDKHDLYLILQAFLIIYFSHVLRFNKEKNPITKFVDFGYDDKNNFIYAHNLKLRERIFKYFKDPIIKKETKILKAEAPQNSAWKKTEKKNTTNKYYNKNMEDFPPLSPMSDETVNEPNEEVVYINIEPTTDEIKNTDNNVETTLTLEKETDNNAIPLTLEKEIDNITIDGYFRNNTVMLNVSNNLLRGLTMLVGNIEVLWCNKDSNPVKVDSSTCTIYNFLINQQYNKPNGLGDMLSNITKELCLLVLQLYKKRRNEDNIAVSYFFVMNSLLK